MQSLGLAVSLERAGEIPAQLTGVYHHNVCGSPGRMLTNVSASRAAHSLSRA
jgi:hypothetical protein